MDERVDGVDVARVAGDDVPLGDPWCDKLVVVECQEVGFVAWFGCAETQSFGGEHFEIDWYAYKISLRIREFAATYVKFYIHLCMVTQIALPQNLGAELG